MTIIEADKRYAAYKIVFGMKHTKAIENQFLLEVIHVTKGLVKYEKNSPY